MIRIYKRFKIALLIMGLTWTGLWAAEIVEPPVAPTPARAIAEVPPTDKAGLFQRVIELNRVQEPELDTTAAQAALDHLILKLEPALAEAKTPQAQVAVLNKILLSDRKVDYLSNLYWRDATLAASLLRGKGNCLALSTLYVVVGDRLKLPIRMVLMPGHAFARWDDGKTQINIETTAQGKWLTDQEYCTWLEAEPTDCKLLGWGQSLSTDEFLAELTETAAYHRRGEGNVAEAVKLLAQAERLAPGRIDRRLARINLEADASGNRALARDQVIELLQSPKELPPTVMVGGLIWLAKYAAGSGNHEEEREFLLLAFKHAPKGGQSVVLQQLSFCHRALKDFRGAVRYMELAAVLMKQGDPNNAGILYNLAILQKNDQRLNDALKSIRQAQKINPESWNLKVIEAGYMVLNGEREAGLQKFATVTLPRGDREFWEIMQTWFFAVSAQRDKFYTQFEKALSNAHGTHILEWIDQDVDLDVYRKEPEFQALVKKHSVRLRGE